MNNHIHENKHSIRVGVFALLFSALSIIPCTAQSTGSWGDLAIEGVRESSSTAMFAPGRYAFDGNDSTAWQLQAQSSSGWAERRLAVGICVLGANVHAYVPEGATIRFYFEHDNAWIPILGSSIAGYMNGSTIAWFPCDLPASSKYLITIDGERASEARIYEISWIGENSGEPFGKIYPKKYSFNQQEYINLKPSRLWDGSISGTWYEALWSFPWEVFQTDVKNQPTEIFPPYKGHPDKPGEIVWELDGLYTVSTLKAYFKNAWQCIAFEFWDGSKWIDKQTFNPSNAIGWQRIALSPAVKTDKIRITFPNGWEQTRFTSQIEVWGTGIANREYVPLIVEGPPGSDAKHATVTGLAVRDYRIGVSLSGSTVDSLSGSVNGYPFTVSPTATLSRETVYQIDIPAYQFLEVEQFIRLDTALPVEGAYLTEQTDRGEIRFSGSCFDGYLKSDIAGGSVGAREFAWNGLSGYELERARVYAPNVSGFKFQYGNALKKTRVDAVYNDAGGYWDIDLSGKTSESLFASADVEFPIDELRLWGSPLTDKSVQIEIWWPKDGMTFAANARKGDSVIGWIGDPLTIPLVDGFHPRQAENLFWMPLSEMGFGFTEKRSLRATGTRNGTTSVSNAIVDWNGGTSALALDQGLGLTCVTGDSFAISGTVNVQNAWCFIQGTEVPIVNGRISVTRQLREGLQYIDIKLTDRNTGAKIVSLAKPVYRTVGAPVIEFDLPYGDTRTQLPTLSVTGNVGNGVGLELFSRGTPVPLVGGRFELLVNLEEGTNSIPFTLKDRSGRVAEKTLTIVRDGRSPEIRILTPTQGQYIGQNTFAVRVKELNGEPQWWQFDDWPWEPGFESVQTKGYTLFDGFYAISVRAQDSAGNISETAKVNFCVDVTPPEAFQIHSNVSGWTNNNRPTIRFTTTDVTSGMDRLEQSLDSGSWAPVVSPYELPELSDGMHIISVRAIDKTGNTRQQSLELKIDTSNPAVPAHFRPVSGTDNITLKWEGVDDGEGFQTYRVERDPAWDDGVHTLERMPYGEQEYVDPALDLKTCLSYRIWAVDRAGNESAKTGWSSAQVGIESEPIAPDGETAIEYQGVTVMVPVGATAEDIIRIQVNEVPLDSLAELPANPLASDIFQFTVVRQNAGAEIVTMHADLLKPVTMEFSYDMGGLDPVWETGDLRPFYYDDLWGEWVPVEDAYVDTKNRMVRFTTNHLSDYSIQATKGVDLSPQQLRAAEFSPFGTSVGHGPVSVSSSGGSVSTSFTEMILPGKNGLDLTLKRTYSSGTAQADAAEKADGSSGSSGASFKLIRRFSTTTIDGDAPWRIADGWRLNVPSMKWNGSGLWMTDLDGNMLSLKQLSELNTVESGDTVTVRMVSHENADLSAEISFERHEHHTYFLWIFETGTYYSYQFLNARLVMNDGRELTFDRFGRVLTIRDATRKNEIRFRYDGNKNQIVDITDTMGRVITFTYTDSPKFLFPFNSYAVPECITSITAAIKNEVMKQAVTYSLDGTLLSRATDIGGREWSYGYTEIDLESSSVLVSPPEGYEQSPKKTTVVHALSSVSGPGIGGTKIEYGTVEEPYSDTIKGSDGKEYTYNINSTRLYANKKTTGLTAEAMPLRQTTYEFVNVYGEHKQYYTEKSTVDDGRIVETTVFAPVVASRRSLSQAPEALQGLFGYGAGEREDTNEVIAVASTVTRVDRQGTTVSTETQTKELNPSSANFMRLLERRVEKAATNYRVDSYQYDAWGNVTAHAEESLVGTDKTKRITNRVYLSESVAADAILQGFTPGTAFTPTTTGTLNGQKSLLASSKTTNCFRSGTESDELLGENVEFELYNYTPLGQVSKKAVMLDANSWAVTDYAYDEASGQISSVSSPKMNVNSAQTTEYAYAYGDSEYTVTTTQKAVEIAADETADLVFANAYSTLTGALKSSSDPDKNITTYEYDALGRMTSQKKPSVNNEIPTIVAEYDDKTLTSTVTAENGGETTWRFDALGRLTSVVKKNSVLSPLAAGYDKETVTTALEYDSYDQVIKMFGPYSDRETDPKRTRDNLVTTFAYDSQGRLDFTIAPGSAKLKMTKYYDETGKVSTFDEQGISSNQFFDWNGNVVRTETTINGEAVGQTATYDAAGHVVAQSDANGNKTLISYNGFGSVSSITENPRTVFEGSVKDGVSPVTTKSYYFDGSLRSVSKSVPGSDGHIAVTTNTLVNGLGWVLETQTLVDDADQRKIITRYAYDKRGNKVSEKSGYSVAGLKGKTWAYDALGNVIGETDELGNTTAFGYDLSGNRTSVADPRETAGDADGNDFTLTMKYDQFNRLIGAALPRVGGVSGTAKPEISLLYDGRGNLVRRKEADGVTTEYSYSLRNWLLTETITGGSTSYTTTHEYDNIGRETKTIAPTGHPVERKYDNLGRVIAEGSDADGWTNYAYDNNGNPTQARDRLKRLTEYSYNPDGQVTAIKKRANGEDVVATMSYDRLGRLTRTCDPQLNERTMSYDVIGRLLSETTPTGKTLTYTYDAWGSVTGYTDARGTAFERTYTGTNKLETENAVNGAKKETLAYTYDIAGDLMTADNGIKTSYNVINGAYTPNAYGLTRSETWRDGSTGLGATMGYAYDSRQRLTGVTTPDGRAVSYGYDSIGQLSTMSESYKGLTAKWIDGTIGYTTGGQLSGYTLSNGIDLSVRYDSQDRVSFIGYAKGGASVKSYDLDYDAVSNLKTKNDNRYGYDDLDRLETVIEKGWFQNTPDAVSPEYGEVERDYTGDLEVATFDKTNSDVTFDAASKSVACKLSPDSVINKIELTPAETVIPVQTMHRVRERDISIYAKNDGESWKKITGWKYEINDETGVITIGFPSFLKTRYLKVNTIWDDRNVLNESVADFATFANAARELVRVWTLGTTYQAAYGYDSNGNRVSERVGEKANAYSYYKNANGGNTAMVKHDGSWWYAYDGAGNRTVRAKAASENADGSITVDATKEYWEYGWDLHNRLIRVTQKGIATTGADVSYAYDARNQRVKRTGKDGTTVYAYGRQGALAWQKNVGTGFERTYAYLGGTIVGWTERKAGAEAGAEARYYAITDHLGSVTEVTDESGKTVWESEYLPFGAVAGAEGALEFGGMYTGKDIDAETGLTYHWNRWRSEDGSSFISEDPARDGMNWYGYCGGNPMNSLDPTGLSTTRDDYAYQQRTNAKTDDDRQAADDLEDDAARDNNGYSDDAENNNSSQFETYYEYVPVLWNWGNNTKSQIYRKVAKTRRIQTDPDVAKLIPKDRTITSNDIISSVVVDSVSSFSVESLVKQNDLNNVGKNGEGPCFLRSLQASAEIFAQKAMSLNEINQSVIELNKNKNQYGTKIVGTDWMIAGGDGKEIIIKDALNRLGHPNAKVIISDKKIPGAQFTIRNWDQQHYQLGDCYGNLLYEPYRYDGVPKRTGQSPASKMLYILIVE